jgi:serine/threonine-protein kinase PpkA
MATDDSAPHIPGYKILNLIGRGANATVYLALQESLNRHVALKILQKFDRPAQAVRFFNEGQIVASMNHPNIITIYDIGSVGSQQYIAMEYLDGGSLKDRIKEHPSPTDALDIVQSIGSALEFVHQMGIVHRDIKPENILFHKRGMPKITDFGVAKALDRDMNLTMDGTALGSPYYLSPEQAEGKDLDGRSDIYSLGVILFEMLAGHKPFLGESQIEVIFGHLNQPVPSLPEELRQYQALVEKMMAKSADERFSSAREMLDYITALRSLGDGSFQKKTASPVRHSQNALSTPAGGRRTFLGAHPWLSSLAALTLTGVLAAFLLPSSPPSPASVGNPALQGNGKKLASENEPDTAITAPPPSPSQSTADTLSAPVISSPPPLPPEQSATSEPTTFTAEETVAEPAPLRDGQSSPSETIAETAEAPQADDTPAETPTPEASTTGDGTASASDEMDTAAKVEKLLSQADAALKKYRLTSPRNRSAYHYYREVLKLDPHNKAASRGIRRIADRYTTLADKALKKGDEDKSRAYVKRGLSLNPRNKNLLAMQQHLDELEAARLAPPPPPPPPEPAKPPPPPKPEPVNSGLQLLESLE